MLTIACSTLCRAAAPVELELATERGVQITAPHQWLQLLGDIGVDNVRIRGGRQGDEPRVTNSGTAERPSYRVLGVLTLRDELRMPGDTFTRADRARLKDYFERLRADGSEALTAARGMFGLTEAEIKTVFADLAQPVDFETARQTPRAVIEKLQSQLSLKITLNHAATKLFSSTRPIRDELTNLSAGTALAILLHANGLVFRPEKPRGASVVLQVLPAEGDARVRAPAGKTSDAELKHWPVGWEPHDTPGRTAPALFEVLNAEIGGYTLEESISAIGLRVKTRIYFDRAALVANDIDPTKIQVRVPRMRSSYKRIIDRALATARLASQVRVDEAGQPFLWITR